MLDIKSELEKLDGLIGRLTVSVTVDADAEWAVVQNTLDGLKIEAEQLRLPWANVSQYVTRLRHHIGVLLGKVADDGHPRQQHVSWAIGDMQALRSHHAFGPALERLSQSPSGSVH